MLIVGLLVQTLLQNTIFEKKTIMGLCMSRLQVGPLLEVQIHSFLKMKMMDTEEK